MPCDTRLKTITAAGVTRRQTISERATEIRAVVAAADKLIAAGKVRPVVDRRTGAVALAGLDDKVRDDVTDACLYRRLLVTGSSAVKAALAKAEALAGRTVNRQAVAAGVHSHDGGASFHHGH